VVWFLVWPVRKSYNQNCPVAQRRSALRRMKFDGDDDAVDEMRRAFQLLET
jgi:hypothetical protein